MQKLIVHLSLYLALPFVASLSFAARKPALGGGGVGRFSVDESADPWQCIYDMVLVERIQGKPKTESGLFVPVEELPRLHLCRGKPSHSFLSLFGCMYVMKYKTLFRI